MKKRILSFLLALLMVVSIFPAPAFATDSTDVTITPTETPTEAASETPCGTCGQLGCTSEHLNWCADCQKDDCGQNHCDTCGAIDCTTEHKICDKCGTLDCTADHTNWCADCKVDNCGQNHCATCGAIDCTKEHKACETCSVIDCTADHSNWCNICKVDNCGKTHVYCETCQKYDCGENHNATEPTEPATEPVAPIDEGDEEETHPMMGKIVTLVESPGLLQAIENPTVSTAGAIVGVNAYPKYMEIEAVVTVGSATYYQLKAADTADNDWPDYEAYIGATPENYEHYWLPSTQVTETELPKPCPVCNEYDCGIEHIKCDKCGEYDCIKIHFYCERCEKYDCGMPHPVCPACGETDCTKTHTWCGHCSEYDCSIEHVDEYKPDTTPVIPQNPTLTPGAEVSIADEYGNAVTGAGLRLVEGVKTSISAWPAGGADRYQWQVRYNNANDLWANIQGETGKGILVSPAMFLGIIDYQGSTAIRCVASGGGETKVSAAIPVIVEEAVPTERFAMFTALNVAAGADDELTTAEENGGVNYTIIIEFKFPNGDTASQPWTASLSAGADYVLDVECPAVVGYKPDRERITETITAISGNLTYTVTYQPDYVDYKVVHHHQNIGDNNYTAVMTETMTGLTGSPVGTGLEESYDGFYDLVYDPEITVAADGSTVINIYYDRYYYLVSLDLNGGYGVEPIYARYGTPVNSAAWIPQRTGYAFNGWSPALPSVVTVGGSHHVAQWAYADTNFTVAFWYENANDEDYTFVGSTQRTAVTGSLVSGSEYAVLNNADNAEHFDGFNADYAQHFTYSHADPDVEIKADGSTVVNVYFSRNTYTLTYYKWKCLHSHTNDCCSLQHTSHSDSCCSIPYHVNHTTGCITNELKKGTTYIPESDLNKAVPNRYNGVWIAYRYLSATRYYVWFDGSWYRTADGNNGRDPIEWNCMGQGHNYTHDHTSGCTCTQYHDHSSGKLSNCNSSACTHRAYHGCESDISNMNHWTVFYQGTFKYEQDVSAIHAARGAERWCPGACEGLKKDDGTYYPSYGQSPAHGVYSSMGGGDVDFYQGSAGANEYKLTFWLETFDGSGSRNYNGKNFAQGTTFMAKMGAVGYWGDYDAGCPAGFDTYEAWTSDSIGGSNGTRLNVDQTFSGSTYLYYNFYYIRKNFELTYFNGSTVVANRTMKYDEPLTSSYDLQNLTMTSPYGSGYYFDGWYLDADCTVPVSWGGTRMPDGGLAVYAKWSPLTHTVTTYQTKGGTLLESYTTLHGTVVDDAPDEPSRDGYYFVSWFYEEDGVEKAYNFSMPVNKDLTLYAVWTSDSLASGTVSYMIEGTNTKIAEDTPISGIVGASKTYSAKTGAELNSGYQTGYFPAIPNHNIEFSNTASQNNWIFYYKKMDDVAYTVRYLEKDTNKVLHEDTTGTSNAGKITVNHITVTGYAADAYSKDLVLSSDPALNVVTFWYTKDDIHAPVQVEHYIQNTAGTGYTHYFSEQPYNGTIGQTQTASPLTLTGFTYNKSGNSFNGVELTASGLVLKLYYDRNSYDYAFHFLEKGTNRPLAGAVNGSGLYGAQVSKVAEPIPGYKLVSSGSLTVTIGTDSEANIRTFYYEEDSVTIRYQVGSVKGGEVSMQSESVLAVTGNAAGSGASAYTDYEFLGWYTNYTGTGTAVSTEENFVPLKNADGVYEEKTYYAKFGEKKVTIYYQIDGPDGSAELNCNSEELSILSGTAVGSTVTVADKYELVGWFDSQGNELSDSESFIPAKPGDKWVDGTTFTAKIVEMKASISYVAVGNGTVEPATQTVDMLTGVAAGASAAPTENVSTFVGWYDNEACTGTALSTEASFKPATPDSGWADTQTYYAKFENIRYTISYEDRGALIGTDTYSYGDTLTLPAVTNGKYIVTWTVKESSGSWEKDTVIKNGTINHYGDVTLVANWTVSIIWINWDFRIGDSAEDILEIDENVAYGAEHSYNGEEPVREATQQFSYSFKEWVEEDLNNYGNPEGIIIYRASYEETVNKYTVTWLNEDGTTIDTTEVEYGTIPTHTAPTKEETAEFTYTFTGWTPEVVAVTGDAEYKATFGETKRSYTITWLNDDDSLIDSTTVEYGKVPTHADPYKAATAEYTYRFAGWTPEVVAVTGEATYKATYTAEKNKYTVTWKNEDGTVLETDTGVEYGTTPSYDGETPTKERYNQYSYTFRDWGVELKPVTGDVIYTATFTPHENFYTVTWVNYNGTELEKDENVTWDTMPEYNGATPIKAGNAQFSYTFSGWNPTVSVVRGNVTYTAQFTESINDYTVTWKNADGTVLETDENVVYGAMPSYDGETPEKAATAQYTYTFDGWDKEIVSVTGDVTYTAKFKETVNKYTVTFVDEDGTTILKVATEYDYGTPAASIVKPADPSKAASDEFTYTFAGWTPEIAAVTGNAIYTATYSAVVNKYTLSVEWGTPAHGGSISPSESVTKFYGEQAEITYRTKDGYRITHTSVNGQENQNGLLVMEEKYTANHMDKNIHIIAYTAPIEFTITYNLDDGVLPDGITTNTQNYTIEQQFALMEAPTKAGYKFTGWKLTEVLENYGNWENGTFQAGQEFTGKYGWVTFTAQWERALVDLTITTTSVAQEQSYIFTVSGTPSDSSYGTITLDVVLVGTDSITIKDLPVGQYTVTEKDGWSWREKAVNSQTADLRTTSQIVSFDFDVVDDLHWLSGYSYDKRRKGGS